MTLDVGQSPLALFRFDASPRIGSGHAARCLALAAALDALGWRCAVAARPQTLTTVPALGTRPFVTLDPSSCDGATAEADALAAAVGGCDLLVVDHYKLDAAFETACRAFADKILVIEDLGGRDHDCDFLVDPALDRDRAYHANNVPAGCAIELGPAYAPLRAEFARWRGRISDLRQNRTSRVLVTVGATDLDNVTAMVLTALETCAFPSRTEIDVVLASAAPHLTAVKRVAAASRQVVNLHVNPPSMAELMALADLAIGSGGSTAWERCSLGLPAILLVVAENQRANAAALAARGAVYSVNFPLTGNVLGDAVATLLTDPARLARMSIVARQLCDGRGARRIAALIDPPAASDGRPVTLRVALPGDSAKLLTWRRDPAATAFARIPRAPTPDEHAQWLKGKLDDPGCLLSIIEHGGVPAGMVRLDQTDRTGDRFEASINIASAHRRLGVGRAALALARQLVPEAGLRAYVMPENTASRLLFSASGFVKADEANWYEAPPLAASANRDQWREPVCASMR